ncbi:hypothetical protein GIB67_010372 [Kingdonia uniflora]|uniref:ENT domain-containing protein n=1 Tax=Kingdonia uniflora TaxID=39325 RepID=A0A7J7MAM2_9MAGN|nr:hypothetical protein GIB67_010372 [Kingdonia uniflora]
MLFHVLFLPETILGTDDDLPPHQNRVQRGGRVAGSGRSATLGSAPYTRMHNDMETQIHHIEQEAYTSVLRAFKAQSDAITWEKESLITELRKELRVSDEEHRELLGRVNADDVILRIRFDVILKQLWRKAGGHQSVHDQVPSTSVPVSRKKQKTSHSMSSLSLNVPSSLQPSSSFAKRGATGQILPSRGLVPNRGSSGAHLANEAGNYDPLVGRKVMTRWPEDKNFYKAVITDYNPVEDLHALVYDINTANEAWEWVNLKEISPDDIRWEGEDPGVSRRGGRVGPGHEIKKSTGRGTALPIAGSGRGFAKGQTSRDNPPSQNGGRKKKSDEIEIFHTDTLIKEQAGVKADPMTSYIKPIKADDILETFSFASSSIY